MKIVIIQVILFSAIKYINSTTSLPRMKAALDSMEDYFQEGATFDNAYFS